MAGRSVIVSAVRTPFGKLGGGLAQYQATELGALAIKAALERIGVEAHEPQYVIMGQVLQAGAGQAPARQAAIGAGLPKETPADTINKVCASSIRAIEIADSMIRDGRRRRRRHRRHGVDVERALPLAEGAVRLPARARRADRLDGVRRAHVDVRRAAHGLAGLERRARARHHPRAAGRVGGTLARARRGRAGRGPLRRRDRRGRRRCGRREHSARHDRREARGAEAGLRPGRHDDRRQRARGERRCELRRRVLRGVGGYARARAARDDSRAGLRRGRLRLPRAHAGEGGRDGARARGEDDRRREPRRDQRGLRVGRVELDEDARRRRGEGERQRRRGRARPSDRRLRRPHRRRRWCTSCAARAAASVSPRSAAAAARATRC